METHEALVEQAATAGAHVICQKPFAADIGGAKRIEVCEVAPNVPYWADPQWALVQESVLNSQAHFIDCLGSGEEFQTSGRDNLKTFALVEAAYASAASGQPAVPEA